MHADASLTPWAVVLGYFVRFAVPLACAAIAIDAARRPAGSIPRRRRVVWVALPVVLLLGLAGGFIAPGVAVFQLIAVASIPLALVMIPAYLLTVVYPRPSADSSNATGETS